MQSRQFSSVKQFFFSLGSSRPKLYCLPNQLSSLQDHLVGLFPGECHPTQLLQQAVFSPIVQLSSCEIQAGFTNASSIHHSVRSPLFSDTCDELSLSVNTGIHMKEQENEILRNVMFHRLLLLILRGRAWLNTRAPRAGAQFVLI